MSKKSEYDLAIADALDLERTKVRLLARRWIRRELNEKESVAIAAVDAAVKRDELPAPEIPDVEPNAQEA